MSGDGMERAALVEQVGLGFVGGYVDTFSFIAMSGLFTAHVTGNLVVAGAGILHPEGPGVIPNLAMIPTFVLSVGFFAYLGRSRWMRRLTARRRTAGLLLVQTALLGCFAAAGAVAVAREGFPLSHWRTILPVGAVGVAAMAIQNALTRIARTSALPTTIMTGNLTQAAVSAFGALPHWTDDRDERAGHVRTLRALSPGLFGFLLGAVVAAPLAYRLHFTGVVVACAVLLAVLPFAGRSPAPG